MSDQALIEPFVRMLDGVATSAAIRAIEAGGSAAEMWQEISESGYLDALVAEEAGGAGLSLSEVEPLMEALGARAVPLPVADTMVARFLLAASGVAAPAGPIVLVSSTAQPVPFAQVAEFALVDSGEELLFCEIANLAPAATGDMNSLAAWLTQTPRGIEVERPANGLRNIAAVLRAALIAGASAKLCDMATAYASERVQFGMPIGRQQALQQMLAVMAEDIIACRIAAQMGACAGINVNLTDAACAKIATSEAAPRVAASAHAVHGAIGISEEYDLQLYTRRLHEWRLAEGSEGYWSKLIGEQRLGNPKGSVDWLRKAVSV